MHLKTDLQCLAKPIRMLVPHRDIKYYCRPVTFQPLIARQSVVELGAFSHLLLQHRGNQLGGLRLHMVEGKRAKIATQFPHFIAPQLIWLPVTYLHQTLKALEMM